MLNKSALFILILSLLGLTLAYDPDLQKSYFSLKPNSSFSYEFPLTSKGVFAHYFDNSGPSKSQLFLLGLTTGDAWPVLEDTVHACQTATPIFQPIHYHVQTDTLVYYCAANASLLIIDQGWQTVSTAIPLNLNGTWPTAKLSTNGMGVNILAMDSLFKASPKASILVKVDMQSRQVASQILLNQNMTAGEAVVAYAPGSKTSYIATNIWQNNRQITKIYTIAFIGTTYQIFALPELVNLTSSTKTITKLFAMGNYVVVNCDTTLYFLNNLGMMVRLGDVRTKELTAGVFHPALVGSTNGFSLYVHSTTLEALKYTIVDSAIFTKSLGLSQDMQVAKANQTSNDLMFTYDPSGVFFNILDLQTFKNIYSAISSYNDLMLTDTTYIVVQTLDKTNTTFYMFDLKTNALVVRVNIGSPNYYYNKDQHTVTFLGAFLTSFCQVAHLDLVSGKLWTTVNIPSQDACSSNISYARITEKGNPELVIPTNKSFLIISETYGQLTFNTNHASHDTDSLNINFDDLSFYYYISNQGVQQINASYYTFNSQSQQFQLNRTNFLNLRPVSNHGFFAINQDFTVGISPLTASVIKALSPIYDVRMPNNFNSVTSFADKYNITFMLFSYFSPDSQYSDITTPGLVGSDGNYYSIGYQRSTTVSGQATGARSYALYDYMSSSVSVVRFINADFGGPNLISF